jgi:hypothetical protein
LSFVLDAMTDLPQSISTPILLSTTPSQPSRKILMEPKASILRTPAMPSSLLQLYHISKARTPTSHHMSPRPMSSAIRVFPRSKRRCRSSNLRRKKSRKPRSILPTGRLPSSAAEKTISSRHMVRNTRNAVETDTLQGPRPPSRPRSSSRPTY